MRTPAQPKCWTDSSEARHTAAAPPSSARCRARYGRQACRQEGPLPRPPSSASTALYRGGSMAPPGHCVGESTGSTATTRARCAARACLAALQGGQAGAHPKARPSKTKPATKQRLDQSRIKTATSPANSSGSGPAFTPVGGGRRVDPPRPRGAAGDSAAERILDVVARAGSRHPAGAGRAWHRLRALCPARQGVPDRQDRSGHDLRQGGLPQHGAALCARRAQGEPGAGRPGHLDRSGEVGDAPASSRP